MQERASTKLSPPMDESAQSPIRDVTNGITPSEVLAMMPCGMRYLFLDEILEVDRTHISARYRFRTNEFFYRGHFPDRAVTPGTVLLEAMCQCGVTAHSYYLLALEVGIEIAKRYRVLFTNSEAEWFELVGPGSLVTIRSELLAWRLRRIRARVTMFSESNTLIAQSILAGTSVSWHPDDAPQNSLQQTSEKDLSKTLFGGPDEAR